MRVHILTLALLLLYFVTVVLGSGIIRRRLIRKNPDPPYQLYYQWKTIDYEFQDPSHRAMMIEREEFIPKNVIVTSIKIFKDRMFITTPRFLSGIPSTLNQVPYNCSYNAQLGTSPKLKPFPSWSMQELSNCSAFQLVQSMEIDQFGRMWLTDSGRTSVLDTQPIVRCPPKLIVMDLKDGDKIIVNYKFPEDVVSVNTTFMKDMNVACYSRKKCFAYISDLFDNKLIVFDLQKLTSWTVKHPTMVPDPARTNFSIDGYPTSASFGISNSALSPKKRNFDTYFYSPIAGIGVYAIDTAILQYPPQNRNLTDSEVRELGLRKGQSDGWGMDSRGDLFFGNLPQTSVYMTRTVANQTHLNMQQKVIESPADLSWIDTFSFDNYGMLALTTNRFQLYGTPDFNVDEVNFRVLRFVTKTSAYSWSGRMICRS